jgi:spore coat protein H
MKPAVLGVSLLLASSLLAAQTKDRAGDAIYGLTRIHKIHLTIPAAEWAAMRTSVARGDRSAGGTDYTDAEGRRIHVGSGFGGYFPWARINLRIGDLKVENAGLRYKGNSSFSRSNAAAPLLSNFKLKLDVYGGKGTWDGQKTFNLHAGVLDTSKMKDAVSFAMFRNAGVPAPRTAYAEVFFTVPGLYDNTSGGVFALIEDVNKRFLESAMPPGTGLLMKPEGMRGGIRSLGDTWASYVPVMRPDRAASPREQSRVMELAHLISQPDVDQFRAHIASYLDVDQFLRFIAVNAFIGNSDSYIGGGHNFYIYLDPKDDKFRLIPWDVDLSMNGRLVFNPPPGLSQPAVVQADGQRVVFAGRDGQPVTVIAEPAPGRPGIDIMKPYTGDHPLIRLLLDDPQVMSRYRAIIQELSATVFSLPELNKLLEPLEQTGISRGPSPRPFLEARAAYVDQLVSTWK